VQLIVILFLDGFVQFDARKVVRHKSSCSTAR